VIIQNTTPHISYQPTVKANKQQYKSCSLPCDTVSFKGHVGAEKCAKVAVKHLIHETAFFREPETNKIVKDYVTKNMSGKDKIRIISGGCSTGEEAVTYSMMFDNMADKVDILGFDLSQKSVEQAKKGIYLFERPYPECKQLAEDYGISAFNDSYLVYNNEKSLTKEEEQNKKLFDKFFEPSKEEVPEEKLSLMDRFQQWVVAKMNKEPIMRYEKKSYKLKDGQAKNCRFVQGDIKDIRKIAGEEKADVILFRNVMYHLTNDSLRNPVKNTKAIVKDIGTKLKDSLNGGGLLVFGEKETIQMSDDAVPVVMKELGFKPLNETKDHPANIWQKQ